MARAARAHGGIPRAISIHFAPDDPDRIVLQSDAWGLFMSSDGGDSFSWICAESYEGSSLGVLHPSVAVTTGGVTVIANFFNGLRVASANGCDWSKRSLPGRVAQDVQRAADGSTLFALTSDAESPARLWRSSDSAESWQPWGEPLPEGVAARSIGLGPDATPVALGGRRASGEFVLARPIDDGTSWLLQETSIDTANAAPRITIDPSDSSRLLLHLDRKPDSQQAPDPPDALYASTNGGQSWTLVIESDADLPGLAYSPSGDRIAIAGPGEGLLMADRDQLYEEGESALSVVVDQPMWGLAWNERGLFAGHDDFSDEEPRFTLGVSRNGGATFEPLFTICNATLLTCASSTTAGAACPDVFRRLTGFEQTILQGSRCTGSGGPSDAGDGNKPRSDEPDGGCACSLGARSPRGGSRPWLLLAAAAVVHLRRLGRRRCQH